MKRRYTVEFKKQALELAQSLGSISEAARQLGVSDGNIHAWREKFGPQQTSTGLKPSEQEELKRLRKENHDLKQVNYILKRAAAFFSQDLLK
jgi:transposase